MRKVKRKKKQVIYVSSCNIKAFWAFIRYTRYETVNGGLFSVNSLNGIKYNVCNLHEYL